MTIVGTVASLWRYPVKSMRGENLERAFLGYAGVYGDRLYALQDSGNPKGFPYLTGREQRELLLCRPRFRNPAKAAEPINRKEAEDIAIGLTPVYADPAELVVDVETPSGEVFAVEDPAFLRWLGARTPSAGTLTLLRCDRAMTDCRPVSLFSLQTARKIGEELGHPLDERRFRANLYADLPSGAGFSEDAFVGRRLRVGSRAVIAIVERDARCKMISLDPDTGEHNPEVLKAVSLGHEGKAGVYGAVLVEGTVREGDPIELLE